MKSNRKIAAALIGSFVLGAGAVQLLHAQTTPPAYTVAMINVKDEEGYKKDFLPQAQKMIKEGGGKYIAALLPERGGITDPLWQDVHAGPRSAHVARGSRSFAHAGRRQRRLSHARHRCAVRRRQGR